MRRATAADLLVLRVALGATTPYFTEKAKVGIGHALRALSDSGAAATLAFVFIRLQLAPLEFGAFLPIHHPGWSGKPNRP